MLNDVHFPPLNSESRPSGARWNRQLPRSHPRHGKEDANTDRVKRRLPSCDRSDAPEAIYGEPEDRGDAFNTTMSATIVLVVALVVASLAMLSIL